MCAKKTHAMGFVNPDAYSRGLQSWGFRHARMYFTLKSSY